MTCPPKRFYHSSTTALIFLHPDHLSDLWQSDKNFVLWFCFVFSLWVKFHILLYFKATFFFFFFFFSVNVLFAHTPIAFWSWLSRLMSTHSIFRKLVLFYHVLPCLLFVWNLPCANFKFFVVRSVSLLFYSFWVFFLTSKDLPQSEVIKMFPQSKVKKYFSCVSFLVSLLCEIYFGERSRVAIHVYFFK